MNDFFITTESTCDFPESYSAKAFAVVPLTYTLNGVVKDDTSEERAVKDFYAKSRQGAEIKTSCPSPQAFEKTFDEILSQGHDVLHISFSSALSATYQTAKMIAEDMRKKYPERKIFVIDSKCASLGQGYLVDLLVRQRENGKSVDETAEFANKIKDRICHYFTVDDLNFLYKGGRVSRIGAIIGQIMMIKPLLHVDVDGRLVQYGKVMTRKLALKSLADKIAEKCDFSMTDHVFISHGDCVDDAKKLAEIIKSRYGLETTVTGFIGPVIGTHSGPGTVALFFVGNDKNEK